MKNTPRPRLQIIRGLPGSGKTTLALNRYPHLMRLETAMFFYRQGYYRFTLENNRQAVKWFNAEIARLCKTGMDFVLTGVFSAYTERLGKAIETALWHGYEVHVKTLTAMHKSVHGVPKEHLDAMRALFVPEKELRRTYREVPEVHFGLMGKGTELAHLKGKKAK